MTEFLKQKFGHLGTFSLKKLNLVKTSNWYTQKKLKTKSNSAKNQKLFIFEIHLISILSNNLIKIFNDSYRQPLLVSLKHFFFLFLFSLHYYSSFLYSFLNFFFLFNYINIAALKKWLIIFTETHKRTQMD